MSVRGRETLSLVRDSAAIYVLAMSAVVWLAYASFYRELGIAPGDVGIGFGQVLERSAGALPYVLILALTILGTIEVAVVALAATGRVRQAKLIRVRRGDARASSDYWVLDRRWRLAYLLPLAWVAFDGPGTFAAAVGLTAVIILPWGLRLDRRLGRILVVIAGVMTAVLAFALLTLAARSAADRVLAGKGSRVGDFEIASIGVPILEFRATPARLRLGRYVHGGLYLGSADGAAVFYDICVRRVRRVASNRTNVTFARHPVACRRTSGASAASG